MKQKKDNSNANQKTDSHTKDNADMNNLDTVINEVATGQKIILFPPGIFIYLFSMLLVPVFPSIILSSEGINWLGADLSMLEQTIAQVSFLPVYVFIMIIPFFLVLHGKKNMLK